ncbi:glycoside hydrolase family 28 protein [Rhizomicrobium electricum]|uniref:Glycoside hydrolase family 28 protein n=1 Tax=Rhizomicrobium electricum TaxID=480070 RepID=A0ABN1EA12_9PROT|nr:glycosyl hydrolase family 28 protein [Rhizomicrobium electricum]NIJ48045.1 polygalacturonase [Rhizomicrobium electricum]
MLGRNELCSAAVLSLLLGGLTAAPAAAQATVTFADRVCNVRDYGATGARLIPETAAFQKAIDDCAAKGGGTVEIPRGWWYVGPLTLKSNIRLDVAKYAVVQFATDPALYGTTRHPVSPEGKNADRALINIADATNVAITGEGTLDGQGYVWWEWMREYWRDSEAAKSGEANQRQKVTRPRLLLANNVKNLLLEGVTFANAPSFHVVLNHSEDITVRNTSILAPASSPNTDAIDPGNSRNVLIEGNTISCGDDIVAIKGSGVEPGHPDAAVSNIVIRNNKIFGGHGISIGSGTSGGVKHVLIENNTFEGSFHGLRIKTRRGYGGEVSDIVFRNNTMKDVENVLTISAYFQYAPLDLSAAKTSKGGMLIVDLFYPPENEPAQPYVENQTPDIHDITIDGLTATGAERAGIVIGLPEKEIRAMTMRNVRIEAKTGLIVRNAAIRAETTTISTTNGDPVQRQRHGRFQTGK